MPGPERTTPACAGRTDEPLVAGRQSAGRDPAQGVHPVGRPLTHVGARPGQALSGHRMRDDPRAHFLRVADSERSTVRVT
jgi:hypothetical protein